MCLLRRQKGLIFELHHSTRKVNRVVQIYLGSTSILSLVLSRNRFEIGQRMMHVREKAKDNRAKSCFRDWDTLDALRLGFPISELCLSQDCHSSIRFTFKSSIRSVRRTDSDHRYDHEFGVGFRKSQVVPTLLRQSQLASFADSLFSLAPFYASKSTYADLQNVAKLPVDMAFSHLSIDLWMLGTVSNSALLQLSSRNPLSAFADPVCTPGPVQERRSPLLRPRDGRRPILALANSTFVNVTCTHLVKDCVYRDAKKADWLGKWRVTYRTRGAASTDRLNSVTRRFIFNRL